MIKHDFLQRLKIAAAFSIALFILLLIYAVGYKITVDSNELNDRDITDKHETPEPEVSSGKFSEDTEVVLIDTYFDAREASKMEKIIRHQSQTTKTDVEITKNEGSELTKEEAKYTDADLYYLAAAVCREAGGESEEIQMLVANVVINRVNSSVYPNTVYEVLTQYKQYGRMWENGVSFPDWADSKIIERCYKVARRILDGERVCPENVLFQAEFEQGSGIYKYFEEGYYFCYYN